MNSRLKKLINRLPDGGSLDASPNNKTAAFDRFFGSQRQFFADVTRSARLAVASAAVSVMVRSVERVGCVSRCQKSNAAC
jgi:negative regulator of sigma E activity